MRNVRNIKVFLHDLTTHCVNLYFNADHFSNHPTYIWSIVWLSQQVNLHTARAITVTNGRLDHMKAAWKLTEWFRKWAKVTRLQWTNSNTKTAAVVLKDGQFTVQIYLLCLVGLASTFMMHSCWNTTQKQTVNDCSLAYLINFDVFVVVFYNSMFVCILCINVFMYICLCTVRILLFALQCVTL